MSAPEQGPSEPLSVGSEFSHEFTVTNHWSDPSGIIIDELRAKAHAQGLTIGEVQLHHGRFDEYTMQAPVMATAKVTGHVRAADLFGIDPGFTGDATTEDYLEANRGEA